MGVGKSTFSFTKDSITVGETSTTMNITRQNQSYNHKFVIKTSSGKKITIAELPVGTTSFTWSPTISDLEDFITEHPKSITSTITVTLYTYNGATEIGWYARSILLIFRAEDLKPIVTITNTNDTSGCFGRYGCLVSGKSCLEVTFDVLLKYGAGIQSIISEFSNITKYLSTIQTITFPVESDNTTYIDLKINATDTRSLSGSTSSQLYVAQYTPPEIINVDVYRIDDEGSPYENGTSVNVILTYKSCRIKQRNIGKIKISYGKSTEIVRTEFEKVIDPDKTSWTDTITLSDIELNSSYDFDIQLTDDFSTYTEKRVLSSEGVMLEMSGTGDSIIIGDSSKGNIKLDYDSVNIRKGSKVLTTMYVDEKTLPSLTGNDRNYEFTNLDGGKNISINSKNDFDDIPAMTGYFSSNVEIIEQTDYINQVGPGTMSVAELLLRAISKRSDNDDKVALIKISSHNGTSSSSNVDINAEHIRIESNDIEFVGNVTITPTTGFIYNIPVWMSGNCNDFRKSGIYYMGNDVRNKPGSGLNGWMEVMSYSTTNVYQRFTTYTGATYVRFYDKGTWSAWKSVYSAT